MSKTDFLVHATSDTVGVVVVEDALSGRGLTGWIMETDETISIEAIEDIPLGHKLALNKIESGETVAGATRFREGKGRHGAFNDPDE